MSFNNNNKDDFSEDYFNEDNQKRFDCYDILKEIVVFLITSIIFFSWLFIFYHYPYIMGFAMIMTMYSRHLDNM